MLSHAAPTETIPDWSVEELTSIVKRAVDEALSQPLRLECATPLYRKPGPLGWRAPTSKAKLRRIPQRTVEAAKKIEESKEALAELLSAHHLSTSAEETAQSQTQTSPVAESGHIVFGDNYALKFKVLSRVIQETGLDIPSGQLGTIGDTQSLINNLITRREQMLESLKQRQAEAESGANASKALPENVKLVFKKGTGEKIIWGQAGYERERIRLDMARRERMKNEKLAKRQANRARLEKARVQFKNKAAAGASTPQA